MEFPAGVDVAYSAKPALVASGASSPQTWVKGLVFGVGV